MLQGLGKRWTFSHLQAGVVQSDDSQKLDHRVNLVPLACRQCGIGEYAHTRERSHISLIVAFPVMECSFTTQHLLASKHAAIDERGHPPSPSLPDSP